MKNAIQIHICAIKELYYQVKKEGVCPGMAAVLCTTKEIEASKLEGVLHLHVPFEDIADETRSDAFRLVQAEEIFRFVESLHNITDLYFCCDSGESRSSALAAAWRHYYDQDEMKIWKNVKYHPNPLVYYLQSVACGLEITREDAQEFAAYNWMLFRRAIANQYKETEGTVL